MQWLQSLLYRVRTTNGVPIMLHAVQILFENAAYFYGALVVADAFNFISDKLDTVAARVLSITLKD
jgi:hypothetical protein